MDEGDLIRMLIKHGDPEVLRTGLLARGWPNAVANEQAQSMRLGLDPSGIEAQMARMAEQYPSASPGRYQTLLGADAGPRPSPRKVYREQMNNPPRSTVSRYFLQ